MSNKGTSRNKGISNPFYGKKHTPEELEKMRLAHLGKKRPPRTPEWSRKISESKKGTKMGEQNPFFGKTHTLETRKRISEKVRANPPDINGDKHPNWQGGITNPRKSSQEKVWSRQVKRRDNYTCQECGITKEDGVKLEAHHIKSFSKYPELRFEVSNGITLCNPCHLATESYGGTKSV